MKWQDLEESKTIVVVATAIKEGRKRGVERSIDDILEEGVASESATREEEIIPKRKQLLKKGPTFNKAVRAKKAKLTPKMLAARIVIQEQAPMSTRAEEMAKAGSEKEKSVEINAKTIHSEDSEPYDVLGAINKNREINKPILTLEGPAGSSGACSQPILLIDPSVLVLISSLESNI